jgi:hypothetical protein|tara:strand:+ start:14 stop:1510 length:1497 start_codon:yes stop_codon:yes gene_type:complete
MSGIRVTYSGLISFFVGIISVFTTLVFVVIVTRTLSTTEFGTWGLIMSLITYSIVLEPIISYWSIRETARNLSSEKTAIVSSGLFSVIGIGIYLIISFFVGQNSDVEKIGLFFGFMLIPLIFLNSTLSSINLGWKPQAESYGVLALGISKIIGAIIFIYFLELSVLGIIFTVSIAYVVSIIVLFIFAKKKIKNKINKKYLKNWLKLFWLPTYPGISSMVLRLDVIIYTIITGSVIGLAFWSAAVAITVMVSQAGNISTAVYAKLIQDNNKEYLKNNITLLMYFAIPITGLSIVFAKPGLYFLNPIYQSAVPIVILLTIQLFLGTINRTFEKFLMGIERVDSDKTSTFRDYIKSKLFYLPTIRLIQMVIFVSVLTIGLVILTTQTSDENDLLTFWAIIWLVTEIPITIYFYKLVKKEFGDIFEYKIIFKYFIIGVFSFGITYLFLEEFLIYKSNIFEFLPGLILFIGFSIGLYIGITFFTDLRTKEIIKTILFEISSKK